MGGLLERNHLEYGPPRLLRLTTLCSLLLPLGLLAHQFVRVNKGHLHDLIGGNEVQVLGWDVGSGRLSFEQS